jgi:hypothetical protein
MPIKTPANKVVDLYEVLGERPLLETFTWDRDDILADVISTLGLPPQRWWDAWTNRGEFFETASGGQVESSVFMTRSGGPCSSVCGKWGGVKRPRVVCGMSKGGR